MIAEKLSYKILEGLKMKKILALSGIAAMTVITLTGCWSNPESEAPKPEPKSVTNVETIKVPQGNGFSEIVIFDVERDGRILTCTTKAGYNSGLSCLPKAGQ